MQPHSSSIGITRMQQQKHVNKCPESQWKQEVDDILSAQGAPIPIVLCVNKVDRIENIDEANLDYLQTEDGIREFAQ